MENGEVYGATTEAHPGPGRGARSGLAAYFTLSRLSGFRRLKVLELPRTRTAPLPRSSRMSRPPLISSPSPKPVFFCECNPVVLSLLAFICEEVVSQCTLCGGLYFFEFVSCSAFLLSLLILIVYCTPVYDRVDPAKVKSSDFFITLGTGLVFFVASVTFALTHDNTITEIAAIVFGMLASFAYMADFSFMLREKCKEPQPRKGETAVRREYLTEPLNA